MQQEWDVEFTANNQAFGSGEHPTTAGCVQLMLRLMEAGPRRNILDMGCGSGILSLVAGSIWRCPVLACDVNPESVEATRRNAETNKVDSYVKVVRSNGYAHSEIMARAPYDLVLCNVLAQPVIAWAPSAAQVLAPGGLVILSGMLLWQRQAVVEAHAAVGLEVIEDVRLGEWVTLLMHKPAVT